MGLGLGVEVRVGVGIGVGVVQGHLDAQCLGQQHRRLLVRGRGRARGGVRGRVS